MAMFSITPIASNYRAFVDRQIADSWAGPFVVSKGKTHDTREDPGFVAIAEGAVVGYVLYGASEDEWEITVLESLREGQGIGSALVRAVLESAKKAGCRRVWLITTNDNTRAIRFYQRFGFALCAAHLNALDASRKLKPQIPMIGCDGIPIQHEFEFEMRLQ